MLNLLVYLFTPELPRNLLWSEPVFRGMKPCVLTMQVKLEEEVKLCSLGILNNYIIKYLELSDWSRVAATATWLLYISYGHCCYSFYNSPPFWRFGVGSQADEEHLVQCAIPLSYRMTFVPSLPTGKLAPHQMSARARLFILVTVGVFVDEFPKMELSVSWS